MDHLEPVPMVKSNKVSFSSAETRRARAAGDPQHLHPQHHLSTNTVGEIAESLGTEAAEEIREIVDKCAKS